MIVFHFTALSPMSTLQWYLRVSARLSTEQRAAEQHAKAEHASDVLPLVEPDLQLHALEVHAGGGRRMDAPGRARPPERGAAQPRGQHAGARAERRTERSSASFGVPRASAASTHGQRGKEGPAPLGVWKKSSGGMRTEQRQTEQQSLSRR